MPALWLAPTTRHGCPCNSNISARTSAISRAWGTASPFNLSISPRPARREKSLVAAQPTIITCLFRKGADLCRDFATAEKRKDGELSLTGKAVPRIAVLIEAHFGECFDNLLSEVSNLPIQSVRVIRSFASIFDDVLAGGFASVCVTPCDYVFGHTTGEPIERLHYAAGTFDDREFVRHAAPPMLTTFEPGCAIIPQ